MDVRGGPAGLVGPWERGGLAALAVGSFRNRLFVVLVHSAGLFYCFCCIILLKMHGTLVSISLTRYTRYICTVSTPSRTMDCQALGGVDFDFFLSNHFLLELDGCSMLATYYQLKIWLSDIENYMKKHC